MAALPPARTGDLRPPILAARAPELAVLLELLEAELETCTGLTASGAAGPVRGVVASEAARARVAAVLSENLGEAAPPLDLEIRPEPFCGVVRALAGAPARLDITLNRPSAVYTEGDFLVVDVTSTGAVAGALHVAFVAEGGHVVMLSPREGEAATWLSPGERARIGVEFWEVGAGRAEFRIAPPFGRALVTAHLAGPEGGGPPLDDETTAAALVSGVQAMRALAAAWQALETRPAE